MARYRCVHCSLTLMPNVSTATQITRQNGKTQAIFSFSFKHKYKILDSQQLGTQNTHTHMNRGVNKQFNWKWNSRHFSPRKENISAKNWKRKERRIAQHNDQLVRWHFCSLNAFPFCVHLRSLSTSFLVLLFCNLTMPLIFDPWKWKKNMNRKWKHFLFRMAFSFYSLFHS